jgi:hypothetical protein
MATAKDLYARADALEEDVRKLREQANAKRRAELLAQPLKERLIYAAHVRCICGWGLAYDPASDGEGTPFKGPNRWECSGILTGDGRRDLKHSAPFPFAFYEIKSDKQPSANGATTRTPADPEPGAFA